MQAQIVIQRHQVEQCIGLGMAIGGRATQHRRILNDRRDDRAVFLDHLRFLISAAIEVVVRLAMHARIGTDRIVGPQPLHACRILQCLKLSR